MFDFLSQFKIGDCIEISAIIVSLTLGIISIIISCKTLKQNSNMIEESTRPCIAVYGNKVYLGVAKYALIIKNFGASSGTITKFNCDTNLLKEYALFRNYNPFEHIVGTTLAPNQSIFCELNLKKLKENKVISFEFEICYKGVKEYPSNKFIVNVGAETENIIAHTHAFNIEDQPNTEMEMLTKEIAIMNDAINGIGEQMLLK